MNAAGLGGNSGEGALSTGLLLALLAAAATVPLWANTGVVFLAGLVLTEALFAVSWNLLFGFTGLVSFGHAAFFAIGAFTCGGVLKLVPAVPFLLVLALAGGLGAMAAAVVGVIALRRAAGIYFAMLTMALGEVLHIALGYVDVLGRDDGLAAIPRPILGLGVFRADLRAGDRYYWFLCAAVLLIAVALRLLVRGRIGRALRAVRDDPERFAFLGADVHAHRLGAFVIAGTVAAMAGALQAPWTQIVTPESAGWLHSTEAVLDTLLGGAASFWGPAFGAILFAGLNFATRTIPGVSELVVGSVLLVIVLVAPTGLEGLLARAESGWRRRLATVRALPAVPVDK